MQNRFHATVAKKMTVLENVLAPIFAKAPHLPESARKGIVSVAPWIALIFGVLGILGTLSMGALGSILSFSFLSGNIAQLTWTISVLAGTLSAILELLAYKPLTVREKKGWNYIFYGMMLMIAAAIIDILFGYGSDAMQIIFGSILGLWILFEVRSQYR